MTTECEICNASMNSISSARLHINGKKHAKALAKMKKGLNKMNGEGKSELEEKITTAEALEAIAKADLPLAGHKQKIEVAMNEDIASAIDDSKYWALVSNMADLNLEDGQIPSREDWKHRNRKMWAYRNALADKHHSFSYSFAEPEQFKCHLCRMQCVDKSSIDTHMTGKRHLKNFSKLMPKTELMGEDTCSTITAEKPWLTYERAISAIIDE